jgi:DNA polymerase III subunit beta
MLKITLLTDNLKEGISLAHHGLSTRSPLPILTNFLIEAGKGSLTISATDLEIGITTSIPAKIEKEGRVVVPGKTFADLINSIDEEKIELEEEDGKLHLRTRATKANFATQSAEEFPRLFEKKGDKKAELDIRSFEKTLSRVVFAAAQDTTRPALSGVLVKNDGQELNIVATDGYRLSLKNDKKALKGGKVDLDLLISARLLREVLAVKKEKGTLSLYSNDTGNQVIFEIDETYLVGRLIESEYPDYQKIIPQDFSTKVVFDRAQALSAVRSCSVFARDAANIVRMKILKKEVVFSSASSSSGGNEVRIDAVGEGEENDISFNARYLQEFLGSIDDEQVVFEMTGPLSPGVFKVLGDSSFLHLIMPIRVQE